MCSSSSEDEREPILCGYVLTSLEYRASTIDREPTSNADSTFHRAVILLILYDFVVDRHAGLNENRIPGRYLEPV